MACRNCYNLFLDKDPPASHPGRNDSGRPQDGDIDLTALVAAIADPCPTCQLLRGVLDYVIGVQWRSLGPFYRTLHFRTQIHADNSSQKCVRLNVQEDWHPIRGICLLAPQDNERCPWPFPSASALSGYTGSEAAFRKISSWLQECAKSHEWCQSPNGNDELSPLPSRVLDVAPGDCDVRLVETDNQKGKYICLSHCWGSAPQFTTTQETLAERKKGFYTALLPPLFRDVVKVTRWLGVRYIWIDSICIIQDDQNDWNTEAPRMGTIYRHAFLTIAATRSQNSQDTLFSSFSYGTVGGTDMEGKPFSVLVNPSGASLDPCSLTHSSAFPHHDKEHPLLGRGWVFQERIIARRVVHFRQRELLWECMEKQLCECGWKHLMYSPKRALRESIRPFQGDVTRNQEVWRDIVQEYTQLRLTFISDRLSALLGLANALQPWHKGRYIAGLWEDNLVWGLGWKRDEVSYDHRPPSSQTLAPTWSWGSVGGHCVFEGGYGFKEECSVLKIEFQNPDSFPRQRRALGCITLRVTLNSANFSPVSFGISVAGRSFGKDFKPDCAFRGEAGESLHCFSLCSFEHVQVVLVVCCVDSSLQLYERIGVIWTRNQIIGGTEAIINLV
jgi:hypothetical protein